MKKIISCLCFFAVFLMGTNAYCSAYAKVLSAKGMVDVLSDEAYSWDVIDKGQELKMNDKVRTGPGSRLKIIFENGTQVLVDENTTIEMHKLIREDSVINVFIGKVKAMAKKLKPKEKFSVTTPATVCSVRGTVFTVQVMKDKKTIVDVYSGIVATRRIDGIGEEISVHPHERIEYELGEAPVKSETTGAQRAVKRALSYSSVVQEMQLDMSREQIQAAAAKEMQAAEYQLGKSMIDAFGKRVRLDEYIIRPKHDEFKFVTLNDRDERFDYFIYAAKFNTTLPSDLAYIQDSFFNPNAISTVGSEEYYMNEFTKSRSNTADSVVNSKSGGEKSGTGVLFNKSELKINGQNGSMSYTEQVNTGDSAKIDCTLKYNNSTIGSETIGRNAARNLYSATAGADVNTNGILYDWTNIKFDNGKYYKQDYYTIDDNGNYTTSVDEYNGEMVFTSDLMSDKIDLVFDPKIFIQEK
ncbi:FecR domain-containing protein [bacterium]